MNGLPLFLFKRRDSARYDEACGFVVAAESEDQARALLSAPLDPDDNDSIFGNSLHAGDEGGGVWMDPEQSSCVQISSESIYEEPAVVLRDFRNG
jgi:hypothetical protein